MNIIRYREPEFSLSRFRGLESLREEMNRLFDGTSGFARSGGLISGWNPLLDVTQDKENIYVKAELPGLKKDEINLSLHEGVLTLSGERHEESKKEDEKIFREERTFGRFSRSVTLPSMVDPEGIKATYRDGILTVELPKAEEAKPKQIKVSA
ncbi:MAG TPA: Hsp20/alpha crystallin family protein [Chthoniobacteraceae bacterium]|nr:Hsp20/alpha crystallin family protein [Chthoniobacteraceae bacterium]